MFDGTVLYTVNRLHPDPMELYSDRNTDNERMRLLIKVNTSCHIHYSLFKLCKLLLYAEFSNEMIIVIMTNIFVYIYFFSKMFILSLKSVKNTYYGIYNISHNNSYFSLTDVCILLF